MIDHEKALDELVDRLGCIAQQCRDGTVVAAREMKKEITAYLEAVPVQKGGIPFAGNERFVELPKALMDAAENMAKTKPVSVDCYGVSWEAFGMSGGQPVGSLMEAVEFYNEKIAKGMKATIYPIREAAKSAEQPDELAALRAENELLKKLHDDASMSAFRATTALLDVPKREAGYPNELFKKVEIDLTRFGIDRDYTIKKLNEYIEVIKIESGWQPIETAPSGGTFIVCVPRDVGTRAERYNVSFAYRAKNGTIRGVTGGFDYTNDATHWMPLPKPPSGEV